MSISKNVSYTFSITTYKKKTLSCERVFYFQLQLQFLQARTIKRSTKRINITTAKTINTAKFSVTKAENTAPKIAPRAATKDAAIIKMDVRIPQQPYP